MSDLLDETRQLIAIFTTIDKNAKGWKAWTTDTVVEAGFGAEGIRAIPLNFSL